MSKLFTFTVLLALTCILSSLVQGAPWEPEGRLNDPNWVNMHNAFVKRTSESNGSIKAIFLGASITNWWPGSIWNSKYEPLGAVNYGISGDSVQNAFWRIMNGEIDGLQDSLKVIVFADCGSNNVGGGDSAQDIARGYSAVIQYIRERLPRTRILLMGLMPRDNGNQDRWIRLADTNIRNSKHDTGAPNSVVKYLDLWNQFSTSWGVVEQSLFLADQLHLTDAGYVKWSEIIDPLLHSMLA